MQQLTCSLTIFCLITARTVSTSPVWKRALRRDMWPRPHAVLAYTPLFLCLITATTTSAQQQTAALGISSSSLPDAPQPQLGPQDSDEQTSYAEGSATVSGTVLDGSGATISGAQVSLTHRDGTQLRTQKAGGNGEFAFTKLPAGSYLVIVNAKGFAPFTSMEFVVTAQQSYEIPNIALSVAMTNTEVTVRPTEVIAA